MLYIIGIGLDTEEDLSLRAIKILQKCDQVILENYTSICNLNITNLEKLIGQKILVADREFTESTSKICEYALNSATAFLIVGTPMFATTHFDLILRAKKLKIQTEIVHNSSIMNAIGCFGLYSYSFGKTISIPFFTENWKPKSFYDYFVKNYRNKSHTLCLLDIKVKECTKETLFLENKTYLPPRFMSPDCAMQQLMFCEEGSKEKILTQKDYKCIVVSRFGTQNQSVLFLSPEEIVKMDFGQPLHSIILPATMDTVEMENVLEYFDQKMS